MAIRLEKAASTNRWQTFDNVAVDRVSKSDFTSETLESITELGITPRDDLEIGVVAYVADQACLDAIIANYDTKDAPPATVRAG